VADAQVQYDQPIGPDADPRPSTIAAICEIVRQGVAPVEAALVVGVCEDAFVEWLRAGKEGEEPAATLLRKLRQAEAEAELTVIGRIKLAAKSNWQAAAWIAERRWPERYARRSIQGDDAPRRQDTPAARALDDPFAELDNVTPLRAGRGQSS
jgi:hypothetical protein